MSDKPKATGAPARDSLLSHLDRNRLVRLMGSSEAATPKIGGKGGTGTGTGTNTSPTTPITPTGGGDLDR